MKYARHRWIDRHRTYGSWRARCARCGLERDQRFAYGRHWVEWRQAGGEWFAASQTPACEVMPSISGADRSSDGAGREVAL
jgi:hypothetical protein